MSTQAQSIDHLYTSGDILLNNPVQWCVIFVGVILVSAGLQYLTQFLQVNIKSKYAAMMAKTSQQEVTVIGVVAILLMLATSFLPVNDNQARYAGMFSWTTMLVFFTSFLYMLEMVALYFLSNADMARWRKYEDSRLDSDDAERLVLRERHYRLAYDRFSEELKLVFKIAARQCPLHENCAVFHKRFLARMSDFSFRCWLSLIVVTLTNFGRAMLTPFKNPKSDDEYFFNALMFMAATGWFILLLFGVYCFWLFRSMSDLVNRKLKRSTVGSEIVPLWDPLRAVEYLQCTMLSMNYFVTVFVLGIANTVNGTGRAFAVSVLLFIPLFVVMVATPWILWSLSILSVLGSVNKNRVLIQRIVRETQGDFQGGSDDEAGSDDQYSELDEDGPAANGDAVLERLQKKRNAPPGARRKLTSNKPLFDGKTINTQQREAERPSWIDDDEQWDGRRTHSLASPLLGGKEGGETGDDTAVAPAMDYLFYNNVDGEDFDFAARKVAPEFAHSAGLDQKSFASRSQLGLDDGPRASKTSDSKGRPIWLESDEELPDL